MAEAVRFPVRSVSYFVPGKRITSDCGEGDGRGREERDRDRQ